MKTKHILPAGALIISLLAGCATQPVVLAPVGPDHPHSSRAVSRGYLRVFSDTETHVIGENTYYYPHTGYEIRSQAGITLKFIPNHIGNMDEKPALTPLPTGQYNVIAEASSYGRVTVPVVIEAGKTTVVHLDRGWQPATDCSTNQLVYLPDGEAVGWSIASVKPDQNRSGR